MLLRKELWVFYTKMLRNFISCSSCRAECKNLLSLGSSLGSSPQVTIRLCIPNRCTQHIQSDALRGMYIRKTKTDSIDSVIIADVIRFGRYCETSVESGDLQAMRELCRQRFYIIDMASDLKRKVIALLDQVFPEYEKFFSDTFGVSSMELLSQYTTPEEMLSVSSQQLAEMLEKASRGRLGAEKAVEIQDAAKNSFGIVMASSSFSLIIRQYIEQIRFLESSVDIFNTEIARLLSGFDTQLTTIMRFLFVRPEVCPWLVCSHIRFPSDSASRRTPLPSAISFPLPGGFGSFTL